MGLFSGSWNMVVSSKMSALPVELIKLVVAEIDDKASFIDGHGTYWMVVWEFLDGLGYTVLSSSDVVRMNEFSVGGSLLLKYFRVVSIVRWSDCFISILCAGILFLSRRALSQQLEMWLSCCFIIVERKWVKVIEVFSGTGPLSKNSTLFLFSFHQILLSTR